MKLWGARGTESLQTPRWREMDSNPRSPGYGEALRADSLSSEQCGRLRMRRPSEFTAEIKQSRQSAKLAYRNPIDNHGIAATINSETTSAPI
jgi:hypothetical protein